MGTRNLKVLGDVHPPTPSNFGIFPVRNGRAIKPFSFLPRILGRLRYLAQWRCKEPVVVFESDDWGMERQPASECLRAYGEPGEWADEQLESGEDLENLFNVLARHRDREGRPVCFTANFVVANPDFEAIARAGFTEYIEIPIGENIPLKVNWLQGCERNVFFPQYHGRSHFWPIAWLQDLQEDIPGSRELFAHRRHGGLSLLKGQGWRYHSEYIGWQTGEQLSGAQCGLWVAEGLKYFEQCFGFFPLSTIAPNYIFSDTVSQAWWDKGIKIVQGAGYRISRRPNGQKQIVSHVLGERLGNDLLCLTRTIKFDPRPQRPQHGFEGVLARVNRLFSDQVPLIFDTHRINFVGPWRDKALMELDQLLAVVKSHQPHFLTTVELAEAILNQGAYRDVWTGEMRQLTPIDTPVQRMLRKNFQWWRRFNAHFRSS